MSEIEKLKSELQATKAKLDSLREYCEEHIADCTKILSSNYDIRDKRTATIHKQSEIRMIFYKSILTKLDEGKEQ